MRIHPWRLAALICPILLLSACASGQRSTARLLDQRMHARMVADVAANQAAVQTLPDGVSVVLFSPSLFPNALRLSDDKYPEIRATVIEGMLDPSLMRVQVIDTSTLPDDQRATRVRNVEGYFVDNGLGSVIQQADPLPAVPAGTAPAGLTISFRVVCPPPHGGIGYGSGKVDPACF